jgi:WD40 repeat protein
MDLHQLVYDGHRFAQYFANTITEHPLLLYTTALPLTPTNTSIYKKFYHNHLPEVVRGVEKIWPQQLLQLQGHNGCHGVYAVAFSPDGDKIASGASDNTIRVCDSSIGIEILPPLQGHTSHICSVGFSPDGSKIISASWDETIRVWDVSTGVEMLPPLRSHNYYIESVAFSPDGSAIISEIWDQTIRVWDASTGMEMLPPLEGSLNSLSITV